MKEAKRSTRGISWAPQLPKEERARQANEAMGRLFAEGSASDGTAAADCVPECSEAYHGYLLLLNIEGEDSKLSCELHHGFCA